MHFKQFKYNRDGSSLQSGKASNLTEKPSFQSKYLWPSSGLKNVSKKIQKEQVIYIPVYSSWPSHTCPVANRPQAPWDSRSRLYSDDVVSPFHCISFLYMTWDTLSWQFLCVFECFFSICVVLLARSCPQYWHPLISFLVSVASPQRYYSLAFFFSFST